MKLADMLAKYGVAGTFYVPSRNAEGRDVLNRSQIGQLSKSFEIGGHGVDHVVLTGLAAAEVDRQICDNKRWLEEVTGKPVRGFCYIRGRYNRTVKEAVRRAGFEYARTVENLRSDVAGDPFEMPTTIQLFPHGKVVYLKNFAKGRLGLSRARLLRAAVAHGNLQQRIGHLIAACAESGGCFHLWGHSWEIEERSLWGELEATLRQLAGLAGSCAFGTNYQVQAMLQRSGRGSDDKRS
jgi:hypothetical protein